MFVGLFILLILTLVMPLVSKKVEENLEIFLFTIGLSASIISGVLSEEIFITIFSNKFLYIITLAVLLGGFLFKILRHQIDKFIVHILKAISLRVLVFFLIIILGLLSSVITAIIASLILVEIINLLPLNRKNKIAIDVAACFSIGLGAALTPIGEPLSTIVVSKLNTGFGYMFQSLGYLIIPGIVASALLGAWYSKHEKFKSKREDGHGEESTKDIVTRGIKIFMFIIALELLGEGFKPVIDTYVIKLSSEGLYWVNCISAVLDNATLAAAEISTKMSPLQIKSMLMGLLISGGMMIPGNIPNIISAGKLKIKSSEWMKIGIPFGAVLLAIYYIALFVIKV